MLHNLREGLKKKSEFAICLFVSCIGCHSHVFSFSGKVNSMSFLGLWRRTTKAILYRSKLINYTHYPPIP